MLLELAEPPDPNELYLRQFSRVFRLGLLYSGSLLVLLVYSILYGLTAKESNWLGAVNSAAIIVLDWNLGTCLFGFELFKRRDTALLLLEHFAFFSSALGCIIVMSPLVARRDALQ
ncbi:calpain-type cysteine protease DEK1-like isoform X3 [Papaver somniferum]|uniref:calpain-type cysteine protease DEK1-like isoform X3 n=1 Tax=Papaver somniferum TaxID=3469 RepID=UPI000E703F22|nr:calpain-type cysteine protease DEK1-like isoform X3 [Papaver somniferum]XP_026381905.1 calpain-type cysteine protease DEK1-like isoform X3 [Papaver somniferum]